VIPVGTPVVGDDDERTKFVSPSTDFAVPAAVLLREVDRREQLLDICLDV